MSVYLRVAIGLSLFAALGCARGCGCGGDEAATGPPRTDRHADRQQIVPPETPLDERSSADFLRGLGLPEMPEGDDEDRDPLPPSDLPRSPEEIEQATALAEAARVLCDQGDGMACLQLAAELMHGVGVERDLDGAGELLTALCEGGEPTACSQLAVLSEFHPDADIDLERMLSIGCEAGDAPSCEALAKRRGELIDPATEIEVAALAIEQEIAVENVAESEALRAACDAGENTACVDLAIRVATGLDGPADVDRGAAELTAMCDAANYHACVVLAGAIGDEWGWWALEHGTDTRRAESLLRTACEGAGLGCEALAKFDGTHVPEPTQYEQAEAEMQLYAASVDAEMDTVRADCEAGDPAQCLVLLRAAAESAGEGAREARADALAEMGAMCDSGDSAACWEYVSMLRSDSASPEEFARGAELLRDLCDRGSIEACEQLDKT